jgi:hypothetical protein
VNIELSVVLNNWITFGMNALASLARASQGYKVSYCVSESLGTCVSQPCYAKDKQQN